MELADLGKKAGIMLPLKQRNNRNGTSIPKRELIA